MMNRRISPSAQFITSPKSFLAAADLAGMILVIFLSLAPLTIEASQRAQKKRSQPSRPPQSERARGQEQLAKLREEFIRLTNEYKKSVEELRAYYERDVRRAEDKLGKVKELYAEGLVSRRDVEDSERAVDDARAKVAQAQQQMLAADAQIAEALVESQALEQMAQAPPLPAGKLVRTTSYIRYSGRGAWSLSNAWKVQGFFLEKFGRQLPVSAFGQSAVHDRWGLDHRNAMDVPLNPDGVAGQALIEFLRSNGIPFSAFRHAIPGSATGPHIHIGPASHRFRPSTAIQ
jgi:hypothetical protein